MQPEKSNTVLSTDQFADQYAIHLLLGQGGQANVYLGSKNNQLYALKLYQPGASKEHAFKIEADFLSKLNFKHLINMIDCRHEAKVKLSNKNQQRKPMIVLELAQGGQLFDFLSKQGKFSPQICRTYAKQIIAAIHYLHSVGVTHRDLKPENILFDHEFTLKVSDFGLSRDAKGNNNDFKLTSRVGTEGYKPPQMQEGKYMGLQADIFSIGVVLFIMYNGTPPFMSTKPSDRIYKLIKDKQFQKFWSLHQKNKPKGFYPDSFKRLMNSFFSAQPDRRPSFQTLQNDQWLKGDQMMVNDLVSYMKAKADKMTQKDPVKQKIALIRKQLFLKQTMQDQCCDKQDPYRDIQDQNEEGISQEVRFSRSVRRLVIKTEGIPQYYNKKLSYSCVNPSIIVNWIKDHLNRQMIEKNVFLQNFIEGIEPENYSARYDPETHKINVNLQFIVNEQEQISIILQGQLHKNHLNQYGVEWNRVEGNQFWLGCVQKNLNECLNVLA